MSFTELPSATVYRQQRLAQDFYQHALTGPVFYVLGCIVASQSDAGLRADWRLSMLAPAIMAMLVWLRWLNRPPQQIDNETAFARWYRLRWALIFLGCVIWATFAVLVTLRTGAGSTTGHVVQLCTIAFGAASASAYALDFRRNLISIGLLFLPQILVSAYLPGQAAIAITMAIFLCYVVAASRRYSREYHSQLTLEYELLSSRAAIHRMSLVDELTGLYNRRRFNEVFQQSWHQAQRGASKLCLVIADIDHFKQINDQYGHQVGDRCLQFFAGQLQQRFRRLSDHVMRIGGEEFAVVLPGSDTEATRQLVEQLLAELREQPLQIDPEHRYFLQASFGIAQIDFARDNNPDASLKRADDALYAAKQSGRARVIVAD